MRRHNLPTQSSQSNLEEFSFRSILKAHLGGYLMRGFVWLAIAVLLVFAWIGSFVMYHVAGLLIHLLLIFALISLVIHLFTGGAEWT